MLKALAAIGGALMAYGLYFFMFEKETLNIATDNIWVMRFRGAEVMLYSKEVLAAVCIVGGAIIACFSIIVYFKNKSN